MTNTLFALWNTIQQKLFPVLEEEHEKLSEKEKRFIEVVSVMDIGKYLERYSWKGIGRKRKSRLNIVKAYVAKAVYNFETTDIMIEYLKGSKNLRRLCGWEWKGSIPSKATFSRAFDEYSEGELPQQIHAAMITLRYGEKLAGHASKDSTAIEGRERAQKKEVKEAIKRKRGRPRKGEVIVREPKRLDVQVERSIEENLKDLPRYCDVGTKVDSKGHKISWRGYKLHMDCVDGDIPVSAILTSASLHDSQAAIPLMQMTSSRITNLYDLFDSAYDAPQIKSFSRELGHIPIIDHNRRRGEKVEMDIATKARFAERSTAERVNSNLKDNYGGRHIRVRGHKKVMAHLMFGIIAITATQLFRLLQ